MIRIHWYVVAVLSCMLSIQLYAKPILTAVCQEPSGPRIDIGGLIAQQAGKDMKISTDGFTGVTPIFVIDDTDPQKLRYLFDNTKGATDLGIARRATRSAVIVLQNTDMISSVETSSDTIAVFSLYPKAGVGFLTYHESNAIGGADAKSVTFVTKCQFKIDR